MSVKRFFVLFLVLFVVFLTSNCMRILVGYHKPEILSEKQMKNHEVKLNIKNTPLNEKQYIEFMKTQPAEIQKRLYQPCQVLRFEKDTLKNWIVNCDVGGFPKLNWCIDSLFNNDTSCYKLSYIYKNTVKNDFNTENSVLVFWSQTLYKPSKDLIKEVQKNNQIMKINVLYVNIDGVLYQLDKMGKTKKNSK